MSEVRDAAIDVMLAIANPGPRPDIHREVMEQHRREWPTLWRALDDLAQALAEQKVN